MLNISMIEKFNTLAQCKISGTLFQKKVIRVCMASTSITPVGWVNIVFAPIADVIQQVPLLSGYLPFVYTSVLVGFSKGACLCPHPQIGKHACKHPAHERIT